MKKFSEFSGPLGAFIKNTPPPENSTIYVAFDCGGSLVWFETLEEARTRRPHLQFEEIERPGFKQRVRQWQQKKLELELQQVAEWEAALRCHFNKYSDYTFNQAYKCLSAVGGGVLTYDEIAEEMPPIILAFHEAVNIGRTLGFLKHSTSAEGRCA